MKDEEKKIKEAVQAAYIQARMQHIGAEIFHLMQIFDELENSKPTSLTPKQMKQLKKQLTIGLKLTNVVLGIK
jgi:hypothetical protein